MFRIRGLTFLCKDYADNSVSILQLYWSVYLNGIFSVVIKNKWITFAIYPFHYGGFPSRPNNPPYLKIF